MMSFASTQMSIQASIETRIEQNTCYLRFARPQRANPIDRVLIEECRRVLDACRQSDTTIVVLEGNADVFCSGADLKRTTADESGVIDDSADALYGLWLELVTGPYISIAHVEGKASAGGLGFVAACNIVIASETATFAAPELLFGLTPACVRPFLARRIGPARTDYLALTTLPVTAAQANAWGLVDAYATRSDVLLRKHLTRLRCLQKDAIVRYKAQASETETSLRDARVGAVAANMRMFADPAILENLRRYVETGRFPWEK